VVEPNRIRPAVTAVRLRSLRSGLILNWVRDLQVRERIKTNNASVAPPARCPVLGRVVAGVRQGVVDTQGHAALNDLLLRELQKRCMDAELPLSLYSITCRQVR